MPDTTPHFTNCTTSHARLIYAGANAKLDLVASGLVSDPDGGQAGPLAWISEKRETCIMLFISAIDGESKLCVLSGVDIQTQNEIVSAYLGSNGLDQAKQSQKEMMLPSGWTAEPPYMSPDGDPELQGQIDGLQAETDALNSELGAFGLESVSALQSEAAISGKDFEIEQLRLTATARDRQLAKIANLTRYRDGLNDIKSGSVFSSAELTVMNYCIVVAPDYFWAYMPGNFHIISESITPYKPDWMSFIIRNKWYLCKAAADTLGMTFTGALVIGDDNSDYQREWRFEITVVEA